MPRDITGILIHYVKLGICSIWIIRLSWFIVSVYDQGQTGPQRDLGPADCSTGVPTVGGPLDQVLSFLLKFFCLCLIIVPFPPHLANVNT